MCVFSTIAMGVMAAAAVAGAGYSVYSGQQAANAAKKAEKKQQAAMNAMAQLSTEQWENYKNNYKPVITQYVTAASKHLAAAPAVGSVAAGVAQQESPVLDSAMTKLLASGNAPSSGRTVSTMRGIGDDVAQSDAGSRTGARAAVRDTMFNRKLGAMTTGRGIPGDVMAGENNLANRYGNEASAYGAQAAQNFQNAIKYIGIGR